MAWAYVWAVLAWALILGAKRHGRLFVPAILMIGIAPDADLFLAGFGIVHRTVMHFFLWTIMFIPIFIIFSLKAIPYFAAVVQHFAFGDFLMGKVMMFWPFNSNLVSLGFGMSSLIDVGLETAGLLLAIGIVVYIGDLRLLFSIDKRNVFMLVPLLALLISALFYAHHWPSTNSLIAYLLSDRLLTILALGHIVLFALLNFCILRI